VLSSRGPMSERQVKVGLVQLAMSEARADNRQRASELASEAAERGANIVCLPELFATRYFPQTERAEHFDLAEPIPGPSTEALARVAKAAGVVVVVPLFEKRGVGLYHNTALVIGPDGRELGRYRKMHIPDDPQFQEKFYFTPGDLGFLAIPTPFGSIGPLICWDQWYPEAARLTALRGAQILCYPTAIGWLADERTEDRGGQLDAWRTIQRAHAIANGVFVVSVNRVGIEASSAGSVEFWGHSFVADPFGRVVAEAGAEEQLLVVECDFGQQEQVRRAWPFLRDRRVDAYQGLDARWLDRGQPE
jgi:N-carbamoylputrescine amidase